MPRSPVIAKRTPTPPHASKENGGPAGTSRIIDGNDGVPGTSKYEEAQNDEIEALQSIYMEDFQTIETKSAWSKSTEKSFRLKLSSYSDAGVSVSISVTLTATYPKSEPLVRLEQHVGLQADALIRVRRIIATKPREYLIDGDVMIYRVASEIQDVLEDDVSAQAHKEQLQEKLPSLGEERAVREAAANEVVKEQEEALARTARAAEAEEHRRMQQMLEEEVKKREEARVKRRSEPGDLGADNIARVVFDQPVATRDEHGNELLFRSVFLVGQLLQRESDAVTTVYRALPASTESSTLCLVVKHAAIKCSGKLPILGLERLLEKLSSVRHPSIANIMAFKLESVAEDWQLDILIEFGSQGSLLDMLQVTEVLPVQRARAFSVELLEALDFYHKSGIVHGRVHCSNVLISRSRSGIISTKLTDAGFQDTLHNLNTSTHTAKRKSYSMAFSWQAPELSIPEDQKKTFKTDIWDFGVVLTEMLFGLTTTRNHTTPTTFVRTACLSRPFAELLLDTFKSDPKRRPNAFDLVPYEFLRTDVTAIGKSAPISRLRRTSSGESRPVPILQRDHSAGTAIMSSRYASEWDEAGRLGKGGYGEVVKARNKLDGRVYAIKKITQKSPSELSQVLSEVHLLATLNHPYVVRYYTAWPEDDTAEAKTPGEDMSSSIGGSFFNHGNSSPSFDLAQSTGALDFISSSGYPKIEFGEEPDSSEDEDDSGDDDSVSNDNLARSSANKFVAKKTSRPPQASLGDSSGLPNIRFQSGSHDSTTSTESRTDSSDDQSAVESVVSLQRTTATLYIQMEFCERLTLRDMIRKGIHEHTAEVWRMFRQVLEGLVHIHSHGIIHRDLKPENIFVDATNNPRIGDFGLATSGQFHFDRNINASFQGGKQQADSHVNESNQDMEGDMTRGVGTTFYVAPELGTRNNYTEKIDMYSLGIILFEMCLPLKTAMERKEVLDALRQKVHTLPSEFQASDRAVLGEVITSLINHKPGERPTSVELLRSGKVPVQIEDDTIRLALEGLSDDSSPYYHKVMSALFAKGANSDLKAQVWDMRKLAPSQTSPITYSLFQSLVKERLISCFRRHGAVESQRDGLVPRSDFYTNNNNVVQLLDASGTLVQLSYDLTLPHARTIAQQIDIVEKTYAFGTVYRNYVSGGAPRKNGEVDFDIVSRNSKDLPLKEAEVIKVMDEILDEIPSVASAQMCFHISHSNLLEIILDCCRIAYTQRAAVKEILGRLNIQDWTWQKIRVELRSASIGVPSTSLDELARFDFRDSAEACLSKLQTIFAGTKYLPQIHDIFMRLSGVIELCKRYGVRRKIYISPLSNFNSRFYQGGIMFQCLFDTRKREVVAAGGRYDQLVEAHRPRTSEPHHLPSLHAVGMNIAWDTLVRSMIRHQKHAGSPFLKKGEEVDSEGQWAARRCDVLVASLEPSVLRSTGLRIMSKLWANDISAELAFEANTIEELLAHYREELYSWIIIIKHEFVDSGKYDLKIKSLDKKEDFDVRSSDLTSFMRSEIRERDQRDGTNERAKLIRHPSHHDTLAPEKKANVQVLMAAHRSKKGNKWRLVESAQAAVHDLIKSFTDGPIASIETRDEILDMIRETRLSDPDSWRKVIQDVGLVERQYIQQVYDLLADFKRQCAERGGRNCFLYNFRTQTCIFYDLML